MSRSWNEARPSRASIIRAWITCLRGCEVQEVAQLAEVEESAVRRIARCEGAGPVVRVSLSRTLPFGT